ncbi:MAG: TIGR02444 family protein [Burkholderiaceae bacterium]|nr:TIGR02444 family protein [Burkholderiaceae bacterium]
MRHAPHPFWRFSLRVYRAAGVQQACLALQEDCGADVNLLLLCGWLGLDGRALDRRRLRQAMACVGTWQSDVIASVRQARRAIKRNPPPDAEAAQALRRQILALELELEYVEQSMLADLAAQWPAPARRAPPRDAIEAGLLRYLNLLGHGVRPADAVHLQRIAEACCELQLTRH